MEQRFIDAATAKFGPVVDTRGNILLIDRGMKPLFNKNARFMTIEVGECENGIMFNAGAYDLELDWAVKSLYERSGNTSEAFADASSAEPA